MAKTREIACIHYICEGQCAKGRDGFFRKTCQTCKKYEPIKHGRPARKDLKREKLDKIKDRDMRQSIKDC